MGKSNLVTDYERLISGAGLLDQIVRKNDGRITGRLSIEADGVLIVLKNTIRDAHAPWLLNHVVEWNTIAMAYDNPIMVHLGRIEAQLIKEGKLRV